MTDTPDLPVDQNKEASEIKNEVWEDDGVRSQAASSIASEPWDASTKRTVLVILLILILFGLWLSRDVLPLLIVSAIIAYLLSPIVDLAERLRIPRGVSTIVLYMLLLLGLSLLPALFAPTIARQLSTLASFDVQNTTRTLLIRFNETIYGLPDAVTIIGFEMPVGTIIDQIQDNAAEFDFIPSLADILTYVQQLIGTTTNLVSSTAVISYNVVGGLFSLLITVVVAFFLSLYMTKDAPSIRSYIESLFPTSYQSESMDVLRRMGTVWSSFFRGQLLLSVTVGLLTWGVLTLLQMPGALILGILAGLLEVIPNIGPILAMIPSIIIALIYGSPVMDAVGINNFGFALIIVAIYFVIQQLENNILVPRIIGSSVNLHPIVVIIGVAVGLNVAGILGALLAAPILASLRVLGSYIHAKLLDYQPFFGSDPADVLQEEVTYRRVVHGDELQEDRAQPVEGFSYGSKPASESSAGQNEGGVASSATPTTS
jgi:predicted PurR-regulated permease PerM